MTKNLISPEAECFAEGEIVSVVVAEPIDRLLDYKAPQGGARLGAFVHVPLGPRKVLGVVWGAGGGAFDPSKLRSITTVLELPPLLPSMRLFLERMAEYTLTPLSMALRLATRAPGIGEAAPKIKTYQPSGLIPERLTEARKRVLDVFDLYSSAPLTLSELSSEAGVSHSVVKGLVDQGALTPVQLAKDLPFPKLDPTGGKQLSDDQKQVAHELSQHVQSGHYKTILLKGVTGSGKTEVYLEAIAEALTLGKQCLVLLPEISLSVEFLSRVEERFKARPAEWHSGVSMAERRRVWHKVQNGEVQLVVGARSALFLPFRELGVIVVDEEHDSSYKQEEGAIYNARDMAVLRGSLEAATVILASATPSLESWANAKSGKYQRYDLKERFGSAVLPRLFAIDMRKEALSATEWISKPLAREIEARLKAKEQSLLFLNRRGFAPMTLCRACGHQIGCPECDARMVEHRAFNKLMCHQCGRQDPIPKICPKCSVEGKLAPIGPGVERITEEAQKLFPEARIAILSSDNAASARALRAHIESIASGEADIIVGTQLVAKGHNFPFLTLVGVIDADLGLQGGDLRAAEHSFQLIRQVSGRAGRKEKQGEAYLQTYQPDHPVIRSILSGNEEAFWESEAEARAFAMSPPYGKMVGIIIAGPDQQIIFKIGQDMVRNASLLTKAGAQIYGPASAPISRIRGKYRVRLLIKAPKGANLQQALLKWREAVSHPSNTRITIDIDPQSFF